MDFDPDAYLASKAAKPASTGFDPDAYLASKGASKQDGEKKQTFLDKAKGVGEAGLSMLTAIPAQVQGGLAALNDIATNGKYGTQEGVQSAQKAYKDMAASHTYQPRTEEGKKYLEKAGEALEPLQAIAPHEAILMNAAARPALQAGKPIYGAVKDAASDTPEAALLKSKFGAVARNTAQSEKAAKVQAALAEDGPRIQTVLQSRDAGYKIPPSQIKNSPVVGGLEKIASDNLARDFSLKNQKTTNRIIATEDLGLKPGTPITQAAIDKAKIPHNAVYDKISGMKEPFYADETYLSDVNEIGGARTEAAKRFPNALGNNELESLKKELLSVRQMNPSDAMVLVKEFRRDAKTALRSMDDPEKLEIGMAKRDAANAVEGMIERNVRFTDKNLYGDFVKSRKALAKINNADAALLESTGDINAKLYAKLYEKQAPLDGGSLKVAKFASAFPQSSRTPKDIGSTAKGHISAWTVARPAAREILSSEKVQNQLVKPYRKLKADE